ncbi:MAG: ribbon-helix-helix domain-containing protein [Promethearchaeota archaeon]|nr:MAG: ribbon-helix-helix domain-containing protein [Candidatus Lokiarchaeota archaeon]
MSYKNNNAIGSRVNDILLERLTEYAKKENINLSKLIREALLYYDIFVIQQEKLEIPIFILGKNEYTAIIDHLNDEALKQVAEICFQNTMTSMDYHIDYIKNTMTSIDYHRTYIQDNKNTKIENLKIPLRIFLKALKEKITSIKRQNWFEDFAARIEKNRALLAGRHNINVRFSIFIKFYLMKIMNFYEYELIEEDLQEQKVILTFQKR